MKAFVFAPLVFKELTHIKHNARNIDNYSKWAFASPSLLKMKTHVNGLLQRRQDSHFPH